MSHLVAIVFEDETTAFDMRLALLKLQNENLIELEDSVVVRRSRAGDVKLDQAVNVTPAGAVDGGFWSLLVGLIFLDPRLGATVGLMARALTGRFASIGVNDEWLRALEQSMKPGTSALFVLVRRASVDDALGSVQAFLGKARVFQASLTRDPEKALRHALERAA